MTSKSTLEVALDQMTMIKFRSRGGGVVRHLTSSLPENVGHKVYFDNYFSPVYLMQFLKAAGIWPVGTIRADILKGAEKVLHDKKMWQKGRGSSDWFMDANSNITIVR